MKAMKQTANGGMMRGPRGGMYRVVGGKKVYGVKVSSGSKASEHLSKDDQEWIKAMVRYASLKSKLAELNEMESVKSK